MANSSPFDHRSLFDLSGKRVLVTGGAKRIGRECAIAFARSGADVAIIGRDESAGSKAVAMLEAMGGRAMFVRCDVARAEQVQTAIDAIVKRFGRLDIAVNNAALFRDGLDESQSVEDWEAVIGVNLTGTWLCARAEMQQMKQQPGGGKIINVASIAASIACSNGAYDASKAGIVHLTRTLATRWGRYNINVNCVSPGYVAGEERSAAAREHIASFTPLGRIEQQQDLLGPILFLASKASDFMTGQNLVVDGGHTLSSWMRPLERSVPARVPD